MEILNAELNANKNDDNNNEYFDNLKSLIIDGDTPSSDDSLVDGPNDNKISPFFDNDKKNKVTPGKKKIRDLMKLLVNKLDALSEQTGL